MTARATTITELRILPPLAIARLGASAAPLENYDFVDIEGSPLGLRRLRPAETLRVDPDTGEVEAYLPDAVLFRDGGDIRPVAPFLEVFARIGADDLVPLTTELLAENGLTPADLSWTVHVANSKITRRTGAEADTITAKVTFSDHEPHALDGLCPNFRTDPETGAPKVLPLGSVRYIRPNEAFPEIRLRFTPAAGIVYGASMARTVATPTGGTKEVEDPILTPERILYDPEKGCWRGYIDEPTTTAIPYETNPAQIYAGYVNDAGNQVSWGYLDDECDGTVSVELTVGGKTLSAFARIGAGPPTFAPDRYPVRTVIDELDMALHGPAMDEPVGIEEAEAIIRRAIETVQLMNTAVMNGNIVQGRDNAASTMVRQDANDFSRFYTPIIVPSSTDMHAVLALHQTVLAALRSGNAAWFTRLLRKPEEVGDLTDEGRRKMPAMMRGADGRHLVLTRRMIDTIAKAAAASMFDGR